MCKHAEKIISDNNCNNNLNMKNQNDKNDNNIMTVKPDILAVTTQYTWKILVQIMIQTKRLKSSTAYKILTRTTQPAHVIVVSVVAFVLYTIWPNLIGCGGRDDLKNLQQKTNNFNLLTNLIYLGAFATHFGSQIWMTFVSGLALYFSLPRHTFGLCQQILFPKYFALNAFLSVCTLIAFIKMLDTASSKTEEWSQTSIVQMITLAFSAIIELIVRLYLTAPLLGLMQEKQRMEVKAGSGQEIGHLQQHGLVRCSHYQNIHKSFRRVHMIITICNILTLVCTFIHLNYLATKINLVL